MLCERLTTTNCINYSILAKWKGIWTNYYIDGFVCGKTTKDASLSLNTIVDTHTHTHTQMCHFARQMQSYPNRWTMFPSTKYVRWINWACRWMLAWCAWSRSFEWKLAKQVVPHTDFLSTKIIYSLQPPSSHWFIWWACFTLCLCWLYGSLDIL